jgi:hypothetical protein
MFRKTLYAAVASLGVLSPLAVSAPADAHEYHHRHHREYHVYYRGCWRDPSRCAGEFHYFNRARCVADEYRARGFEVYIR